MIDDRTDDSDSRAGKKKRKDEKHVLEQMADH